MADPTVTPEQATAVLQQVTQTQSAAQPIRIETQTGQVFEGNTPEEVIAKLTQSVESGTAHIRNLNERLSAVEQQSQQTQQSQQPGQKTYQDQYWELWQKDPIQADRYAASVRLGVPMEAVDQVERQTIQNSYKSAQDTAVGQFLHNCPDFPNDQNSAYLIKTRHQELFPNTAHTAHTLEATFSDLVSNGMVEPLDIGIEGTEGGASPLPQVGPGAQAMPVDFEAQFRSLPSDQMAKVIQELHARGAR